MRITLRDPELELEVKKVDTPTGAAWCVIMPDNRKVLVRLHGGKWETEDRLSDQFVQAVGHEISGFLEEERRLVSGNNYLLSNVNVKRARTLKYLLT